MLLVTIGMCALSVAMTWPVLLDPARTYPGRTDPLMLMWAIAWAGHGLAHMPAHVFDGNVFYPAPLSLAFSDSMLGYGPIKLLGGGPGCVLVDYNLVFVAAPALTGVGGYALARQLGASPLGAAAAGLGLAFAPWRAAQFAHLHVLSTGQFTAALAMLARGHGLSFRGRKGPWRPLWVALGWLFAAWQVTIGFAVGLPFTYLLAVIALAALACWLLLRMPRLPWRLVTAELAGGALFCAVTAFMGAPYLEVARIEPDAVARTRSLAEVQLFSPTWRQLLEPPGLSGTWSWLTGARSYSGSLERFMLPGYVLITLAVIGLFYSAWLVRWRVTLALGTAAVTALALGTHLAGHGEAGFVFLWRHAPGWAADRTPGRLIMIVALGLAILAAGAVTRLTGQPAPDGPRSRAGALRLAAVAVLPALVLAEGYYRVPESTLPPVPAAMAHAPAPFIVLPSAYELDPEVMVWSAMRGFPEIGNGSSGIEPDSVTFMRKEMYHFPTATAAAFLRSHGFRSVVVLKDIPLTPQANPNRNPAPSLGLRRIDMGDSVLYLVERGLLVTTSNQQTVSQSGHAGGRVRARRRNPHPSGVFREMVLVTIGMCALSVFMTWPALRDPAHTYPSVYSDPLILVWAIAWAGHGLAHMPAHVFDGNVFYPAPLSLAFSDSMLGYGPIKLLGGGPGSVLVDYNLVFVAAPALTGVGGYALARQLGASPLGAAAAGLGLAFAPWRAAQSGWLHVLSTGQLTAALAMLARGHGLSFRGRKGPWRPLWVALGWLFAAWQVTIGFQNGLPFAYLLAVIALATLAWWLLRRTPRLPWRLVAAELAGGALFCAVTAFMAAPYLTVARTDADTVLYTRRLVAVQGRSPTWPQLLEPPDVSGTWSWLAGRHPGYALHLLLPGYALITLAVIGLFYSAWLVRWRVTLALGTAAVTALALGTHLAGHGEAGFVFLWRHAPGWAADRAPGWLIVFVTLGLSLLAAGAVTRLAGPVAPHRPRSRAGVLRLAAAAVLPLLVLAEGYSRVPQTTVPPVPAAMKHAPGPLIVLPATSTFDKTVMVWSAMTGFPEIGNGASGIAPDSVTYMRKEMTGFPDATSVTYLRSHHFRSVVVLKDQTAIPPGARIDPGRLPAPSLGLRRIDMGDSVLYLVEPRLPGQPLSWLGGTRGRIMVQ